MRFGLREAIFVLLLLAVPVAAYFVVFKERNEKTAIMREEMRRDQEKLVELEKTTMLIQNLDEEIVKLTEAIETFEQKLPAQREVEGVLKEVTALASANRLTIKSIRPSKIEKQAQYAELPIKLQIVGDFDGFYMFLQQLEQLPRITSVPEMTLKKDARGEVEGAMAADMTLTIYFEGDAVTSEARSRL